MITASASPTSNLSSVTTSDSGVAGGRLPHPVPTAIFRALEDGGVVFTTDTETYFGLNEVAAKVWELLPPATASLDELVSRLAAHYAEVPAETIREDVVELLGALHRDGLVAYAAS